MIDISKSLGVQSWCFRAFKTNAEVAAAVKEVGLNAVELSAAHIDWKKPETFDDIVKTYRDAGVEICSIGVVGFAGDEKAERNYFEFARKAGCRTMSMDFAVDKMPQCTEVAQSLAEEYDMVLGIHNHGGRHWLGNVQMITKVLGKCSDRIGLYLDTAWALDAGEDPVAMAEKFNSRLFGLHIKDFTFDRARHPEDVVAGTGNLDLPKLYAALKKMNFQGCAVSEYEGDVNDPVPAVKKCIQVIKQRMKG